MDRDQDRSGMTGRRAGLIVAGNAVRKTRRGRETIRTLWSCVPPALQTPSVFRFAIGRQMRRSPDGGIMIKSAVAVFG
jgi:hypothetical protein